MMGMGNMGMMQPMMGMGNMGMMQPMMGMGNMGMMQTMPMANPSALTPMQVQPAAQTDGAAAEEGASEAQAAGEEAAEETLEEDAAMESPSAEGAPAPGPAAPAEPETMTPARETFEFASEKKDPDQLPINGIGFLLGMSNADDAKHGEEFKKMMEGLNALAAIKGNRRHLGDMAYEGMLGNTYDKAIAGMKQYRRKLKFELVGDTSDREDRQRQIALLKDMITRAKADKKANRERQSTTVAAAEKGEKQSGGINTVTRVLRKGKAAFFKPQKKESDRLERNVMADVGIQPAEVDKKGNVVHDPRLANREIAYSRLGALLGSSVTLDAKKAMDEESGTAGVLTEEAKGKTWDEYNWNFFGLSRPASGGQVNARATLGYTEGRQDANLGDRLDAQGIGLQRKTLSGSFNKAADPKRGEALDVADADFQRQMNEMFLLDTLAGHRDRHGGNFHINRGEDGKIGVKAIDNDLTFGSLGEFDEAAFGKRGLSPNYTGLPAQMQIDAKMAQKIRSIDRPMLDQVFGDLLEPKEIESLWTRFKMMKEYIDSTEHRDPSLLVKEWNEETAKREMRLAGGIGSHVNEDIRHADGYSGNNYYQRQMLALNASDMQDPLLFRGILGG